MPCIECHREIKIAARGLCSACYFRLRQSGAIQRLTAVNTGKLCSVPGCGKNARAIGLCSTHYEDTRPPLHHTWRQLRSRSGIGEYPATWQRFEAFVADVGAQPSPRHQLRRTDSTRAWSKENAVWLEPVSRQDHYSSEHRSEYARAWNLRGYGITLEAYEQMATAQDHKCAICGKRESHTYKSGKIKSLAVDHDHATGKVRGLLCFNCNQGLGRLQDDIEILRRAIAYLERH